MNEQRKPAAAVEDDEPFDIETGEILAPLSAEVSPVVAAEINQQVATARRYPRRRDKEISTEIMSRATLTEEIAGECQYTLKRRVKPIVGPSIRFAEIVRASFGNIRVASRFVRIDADDPTRAAVIVESVAFDTQTNSAEVIPVRRSIMTSGKDGHKPRMFNADMTNTTVQAAVAIARRNAILAVVPKAIWQEAYQRVVKVLQGDANTLSKRREDIVAAFGRVNVKPEQLFAALEVKSIEDITIEHMPTLIGMMTAIKEGESPDNVLGRHGEAEPGFTPVKSPLKDQPEQTGGEGAAQVRSAEASQAKAGDVQAQAKGDGEGRGASDAVNRVADDRTDTADVSGDRAQAVEGQAEGATPATIKAYERHFDAWLAAETDPGKVEQHWRAERGMRKPLNIIGDDLESMVHRKDERIAALRDAKR